MSARRTRFLQDSADRTRKKDWRSEVALLTFKFKTKQVPVLAEVDGYCPLDYIVSIYIRFYIRYQRVSDNGREDYISECA